MARAIGVGRVADAHARSGRAGVDHRDLGAGADDPRLGAGESIGRWIGRKNTAHKRLMLLALAGAERVGPGLFFGHAPHVASHPPTKKGVSTGKGCGWSFPSP